LTGVSIASILRRGRIPPIEREAVKRRALVAAIAGLFALALAVPVVTGDDHPGGSERADIPIKKVRNPG
jgi:hypothetical protein